MHDTDVSNWEAHRRSLRSLAWHLVGSDEAEDHVQDTLATALASSHAPRAPGVWLKQVLRNSVRGRARRARRWVELQAEVPAADAPPRPDELAEDAELAVALREVLDELDEPYRSVLRERFFEDRTTIDIARRLGCPHGTIRWRVHEGLQRMRSELDRRYGKRTRWYGGAVLLSAQPGAAAPITGTEAVPTSSTLHAILPFAIVGIAASLGCFALVGDGDPPTTRSVESTVTPAASATDAERSPEVTASRRRAAKTSNAAAMRTRPTPTPSAQEPETLAADGLAFDPAECARDEIAAFNADPTESNADEHLVDAARCFEQAGMVGKAVLVHTQLVQRYPDSLNAEDSDIALRRLYRRIVDADAGLATPLGKECVAPIEERGGDAPAEDYIAAADCLFAGGTLAAAALQYRELATARPGDFDAADNQSQIEYLQRAVDSYAPRADDPP